MDINLIGINIVDL